MNTNQWPEDFTISWKARKNLLKDVKNEENEKIEELKYVKILTEKFQKISEPLKSFRNGKLNKCLDILNHLRVDNTISQDDLDNIWINFPCIKEKVDKELIGEIRKYLLDETIDCCFAGIRNSKGEEIVFKYPKVFYCVNGHFFEQIIYSIFFEVTSKQFIKSILIDKIVRDNGLMNECGYLVPNDLCEIFKRIDSL